MCGEDIDQSCMPLYVEIGDNDREAVAAVILCQVCCLGFLGSTRLLSDLKREVCSVLGGKFGFMPSFSAAR